MSFTFRLILFCCNVLLSECCVLISRFRDGENSPFNRLNLPTYRYPKQGDEFDGFVVRIKYKPTVLLQKHTYMDTPMSSACVKCGICIVISEKLEQILKFANDSLVPISEYNDEMAFEFLRPVCDYGFQSYGLKEWQGLRVLSHYLFLDKVPNSMEGLWSDILEQSCHFYLNHFGERNLIKLWLSSSETNVTTLLCRNDGLFRDCLNLNQGVMTIQSPSKFFSPGSLVEVNYPCV